MKHRRVAMVVASQLLAATALSLLAAPAQAASTWDISQEINATGVIPNGGLTTITVNCPAGTTPISGGYGVLGEDLRRMQESTDFGSGAHYQVTIDNESGSGKNIQARAKCVSTGYFTDERTKFQSFTVGSDHLATGIMSCDPGWFALSSSISFSSTDGTLLTSTPDLEFDGWFARGWSGVVGSSMWVFMHCVPQSNIPGARVYQTSQAVGWGTTVSANCPSGLVPITGGTYESGGDGGAITVDAWATSTGWTSTALTLDGGSMVTNVVCIAAASSKVTVSLTPVASDGPRSARFTFSATDTASAGGYTISFLCSLGHGPREQHVTDFSSQPCTSPFQVDNLADADYSFGVTARTSDGRSGGAVSLFTIDHTAPVVTFDDAPSTVYGTSSPEMTGAITDLSRVAPGYVSCAVDSGAPTSCAIAHVNDSDPNFPYYDYRGTQTFYLYDVTDGPHVLHIAATDTYGNAATTDFPFTVDITGPVVTETGPTSPVTVATSTTARWRGSDATGISSYAVQWQRASYDAGFGTWSAPLSTGTATSRTFSSLRRGSTYCYRAQGTDTFAHVGGWSGSKCTAIPLDDRDLVRSTGWTRISPKGWFRGTGLSTTKRGATLTVTGAQLKRIAVEAKKCKTCGTIGVYVGTKLIGKIDLHASTTSRRLLSLPTFSFRKGTVKLKVLTSGKPVQIDAVALSRV